MTACSSSSLPMALDIFRRVPTDCDIWDSWASWWFTRCSCCRIWFWRSSWVELTEFVFVESLEGEPVVASRLYLVFWLRMTLGTKLLLLWPEAEVGLDKDVMSMGVWNFVNNGTLLRKVNRSKAELPQVTSESKKPGEIAVVIHYCDLTQTLGILFCHSIFFTGNFY